MTNPPSIDTIGRPLVVVQVPIEGRTTSSGPLPPICIVPLVVPATYARA